MGRTTWSRLLVVVIASALGGCDQAGEDADAAGLDAAVDVDGATGCAEACDDGLFCNGEETCVDDACVAGESPCETDETCDESDDACGTCDEDADGDGVLSIACGGRDCDDEDADNFPGNSEICDDEDHDEDCDATTYGIRDLDGDDEPDAQCCNDGDTAGERFCGGDCDDTRGGVGPSAVEACDSRDNDCDGAIDEEVLETFYPDTDGDSYGDAAGTPMTACFRPEGFADNDRDCNDADSSINPGLGERCDDGAVDENCDGIVNPIVDCRCTDGDDQGCDEVGACAAGTEICAGGAWGACSIAPVTETCNGIDDDCSGVIDEGLTVYCFVDGDNDGYAATGAAGANACPDPTRSAVGGCPNFTTNRAPTGASLDCADDDGARRPLATETCNAIDDNCDGVVDETLRVTCYTDADNDTYAPAGAAPRLECVASGRGEVGGCPNFTTNRAPGSGTTDCADNDSARRPTATEVCVTGSTAVDDDCDGSVDEGVSVSCYIDGDADNFAAAGATASTQCRPADGLCPVGYTGTAPAGLTTIDCAPGNAGIHPNATEVCNGADDDCNGVVDNGVQIVCYTDGDDDDYPHATATMQPVCAVATGRAHVGGCPNFTTNRAPGPGVSDCNDASTAVYPGATEVCNAVDDNCSGASDETFGCRQGSTQACTRPACMAMPGLGGTATCSASCVLGACVATEVCNGCDDDADTSVDDGFACQFGASLGCNTACGTVGSQPCNGSCSGYGACTATMETCNFCDDRGDGADDRGVAGTQVASGTYSGGSSCTGLTPAGTASCPNYNPTAPTWGDVGQYSTASTVRVGWGTVVATSTYMLTDGLVDGMAPIGSVSLMMTNGSSGLFLRTLGLTWDVGAESIRLYRRSGTTTTTIATVTRGTGFQQLNWNAFDTDELLQTYTLRLYFRPVIDGATAQAWFDITYAGTTLTSATFDVPSAPLATSNTIRAVSFIDVGMGPWHAEIPNGSGVSVSAATSCP